MLEKDSTIVKINGRNTILDIREAFIIDKVKMQFRSYDMSKPAGSRTTNNINIYMGLQEFAYFCEILKTQDIYRIGQQKKERAGDFPEPAFSLMGGSVSDGKTVSRQFRVEIGERKPLLFSAFSGPGRKNETGLIIPQYKLNTAENKVTIGIDMKQAMEIGLAGQRAIAICDMWTAMGVLEERCQNLRNHDQKQ